MVSSILLSVRLTSTNAKLKENLEALLEALKKAKPANAKGQYIKKILFRQLWVLVYL